MIFVAVKFRTSTAKSTRKPYSDRLLIVFFEHGRYCTQLYIFHTRRCYIHTYTFQNANIWEQQGRQQRFYKKIRNRRRYSNNLGKRGAVKRIRILTKPCPRIDLYRNIAGNFDLQRKIAMKQSKYICALISRINKPSLFLLCGGISVCLNALSRYFFSFFLPFHFSLIAAYGIGMATAFILFKAVAFGIRTNERLKQEIGRFCIVNMIGLIQTTSISMLLKHIVLPKIHITSHVNEISHLIALSTLAVTSYIAHKSYTFKK